MSIRIGFTAPIRTELELTVRRGRAAGFDFVEVLFDGPFARERLEARREEVRAAFESQACGLVVHLPFAVDVGSPFEPARRGAVDELLAGVDLAAALGAEKVVYHPSSKAWDVGWTDDELRPLVRESVETVADAARDRGVEPCIENVGSCPFDLDGLAALAAAAGASLTFDTGHAFIAGHDEATMARFLKTHRERVSHVHLSDTRSDSDEHLPVGMGRIDFETALSPLLDGWSGTMTHEVGTDEFAYIDAGKVQFDALVDR
ncbi:sugar phosphate isomerase/epimerase family protein [Haloferacaceae archaeon DSL9]